MSNQHGATVSKIWLNVARTSWTATIVFGGRLETGAELHLYAAYLQPPQTVRGKAKQLVQSHAHIGGGIEVADGDTP